MTLEFLQAFLTVYSALKDLHTLYGHFSKDKSAFLVLCMYRNLFCCCFFLPMFSLYSLLMLVCDIEWVETSSGRGHAVPVVVRWLRGGLHQVITFSFSRNAGYFCFLLSLRRAPLLVTAFIAQFGSCSSYVI